MDESDYCNPSGAADYVKLAPSTLAKKRLYGDGPAYMKIGRRVICKRTDLDAWLACHRRTSTSDIGRAA